MVKVSFDLFDLKGLKSLKQIVQFQFFTLKRPEFFASQWEKNVCCSHLVFLSKGIRSFRRQTTKEEKVKNSFTFEESFAEEDEDEDVDRLRDDLESTKQLLELEVRSKKLLEKDNKRLQQEMERLKADFAKLATAGENAENLTESEVKARRNSIASKRQSMIRLLSESEDDDVLMVPPEPAPHPVNIAREISEEPVIEVMREEVDEARKLAEEWEHKYKEMQRQMSDLETGGGGGTGSKKHSVTSQPSLNRMSSLVDDGSSIQQQLLAEIYENQAEDDDSWMQKREIHQLESKLRNIHDKREVVTRERKLLNERIEVLIHNIGQEVEARKRLRKEIKDMNEAFKKEIAEMCAEQQTAEELEECYFSDEEDLVVNTHKRDGEGEDEEDEEFSDEENDVEETLDDIIKLAEDEDEEQDPGHDLFESYPMSDEEEEEDLDDEGKIAKLNGRCEKHNDRVATMRRSNFMMKSKIDRLYDILQMQKEKHHDLHQELTRMLADIQ